VREKKPLPKGNGFFDFSLCRAKNKNKTKSKKTLAI